MKAIFSLLLIAASTVSLFAEATVTNAPSTVMTLPASSATVTAPIVLAGDNFSQPDKTELSDGGKAVFNFTVTNAGVYLISAVVNAPDEDSNSFFVNVDANPEDPKMIWDMEVTNGFEERTVNWRGNGDVEKSEFAPKSFNLSVGPHKLMLVGREPVKLKTISIRAAAN